MISQPEAPLVSIIIRTKNEERWIGFCLRAVFEQNYPNLEVVLVDNESTDRTVDKASAFDIKLVRIKKFLPGKAINLGIENASGEIIVCLSGHCIPTNPNWLSNLVEDLSDENVAAVYGRQEPMSFSSDFDKRDLITVFGLDKKVQTKDPFFHNANSAFRRDVWERVPFDDEVTNIEDRVWAKQMIDLGFRIHYEPEASVYHYHGIHQDMDRQRARQVVQIMESVQNITEAKDALVNEQLRTVAIIPSKGELSQSGSHTMLQFPIEDAVNSDLITDVVVSTDNALVAERAKEFGATLCVQRPPELSADYIDVREVFQFTLEKLEENGMIADLVVILEETYPFRPTGLLDEMIKALMTEGFDSIIAAKEEFRHIRQRVGEELEDFGEGHMPRQLKESQIHIDLMGLGTVTHPSFIRDGSVFGRNIGVYDVKFPLSWVEVRDDTARQSLAGLVEAWSMEKQNFTG